MILTERAKFFDILLLFDHEVIRYSFKLFRQEQEFLQQQSFASLDQALVSVDKNRALYLITSGEHFFEETTALTFVTKEKRIMRQLFEEQLQKNPSLLEPLHFNFYPLGVDSKEHKSRFYLYGYRQSEYEQFTLPLERFNNVKLLTSSRQLLYAYSKEVVPASAPYIAIYRLKALEIMVVSDATRLIFSRVHRFTVGETSEELARSIAYVMQRFKGINFSLYLGGEFEDLDGLLTTMHEQTQLPVHTLVDKRGYPSLLDAVRQVPGFFNFVPKYLQGRRFFFKSLKSLSAVLVFILLFGLASMMVSWQSLRSVQAEYDALHKRYRSELSAFDGKELYKLDLMDRLATLKIASSDEKVYTLLKQLAWLKGMQLLSFSWDKAPQETFTVTLYKKVDTLAHFEDVSERVTQFEQKFGKAYPKSRITVDRDYEHLTIHLKLNQEATRHRRVKWSRNGA